MISNEKLEAILAAVQVDVGNRGLAKDPHDNLFTATVGDFQTACRSYTSCVEAAMDLSTGFFIPSATPPAYETDGPLGCAFLMRAISILHDQVCTGGPQECIAAIAAGLSYAGINHSGVIRPENEVGQTKPVFVQNCAWPGSLGTHSVAIECVGRASDGRRYSMRGRDISEFCEGMVDFETKSTDVTTIGIGDGGNEIGMGKIPHDTIVKNIPNGDLIHCRVPTDHLIVAGVSNWGAYALAAGVFVLRGKKPPKGLFDPDNERRILEAMVREGPLVDGVTGQQTATVDGLSWDDYVKPLIEIGRILEK